MTRMEHQETGTRVLELVQDFVTTADPDRTGPVPATATLDELGVDSLAFVDLLSLVERELGVEVPDEALPRIATVQDLVDHISSSPERDGTS
ncbi:phosphopantetheine-binding protein [Allokutzneria sp. A3M-2-11 16]|uniref:acyl carrier protein n=1 Tax=Allokutzneria sp. A3M-2-11 16 TaxID=2962043 RepID=UPI0020B87A35|nr:phosphopantetheine-binding protein [Allokutzneria sp. A3M-2-11 16]MCP3804805.1 phosphopantetheine-binding protein [Allokutzneria sp. A3M-2-11 16]